MRSAVEGGSGSVCLPGHDRTWIVSIRSHGSDPLPFTPDPVVLAVQFDDLDPDRYNDPDRPSQDDVPLVARRRCLHPEQADAIVAHVARAHAHPGLVALLVHCDGGVSRSGSVVEFAAVVAGLPRDQVVRQNPHIVPNWYARRMLDEAWLRVGTAPAGGR